MRRSVGVDLRPSTAEAELRSCVRAWLRQHLPPATAGGPVPRHDDLAEEVAAGRRWQAALAEGGWVAVAWPEAYGGRGLGPVEHYIVQEELARARAPELVGRIGVNLAGPTLLVHGTEAQKERWLGRILRADDLWCQLFSEPGAGSDLASLTTRATPTDGGWLLNGQKVWTSYAQFADWGVCLARTDPDAPPRRGISYLVVDMRSPGVEVRPLRQLTGESEFNEVFFTDVFVPSDQLVGPEHGGWRVANSTLSHERGTNPRQLVIHLQLLEDLLALAEEQGSFDDERTARRLAQAFVEVRLFQLHNLRTVSRLARGDEPGPEGSSLKLYWSEMSKRFHRRALEVLGPAAPLWRGARRNPGDGRWQRSWLYYQGSSIWAGTNEIQRNIVGERVLGLPRPPARQRGAEHA
ncbi:MAG TPA: acyl-CoA dehydrogenase family protein [Acidimicrobiales bacterium]|nr:acyl-CoA dehydrogenase family protein [Acidimicrobiales bacterium]